MVYSRTLKERNGQLPDRFGFRSGPRGTHSSRTIMLAELRSLMDSRSAKATRADYRAAVIDDNVLGKKTATTRRLTAKRLGEYYALDTQVTLFRLLRFFWDADREGRPLLAFLCASARDPLLRLTAPAVLEACQEEVVAKESLEQAIADAASDRFKPAISQAIARRAISSWAQAGFLSGRLVKRRTHPIVTPANVAYALAIGFLAGARGQLLFTTFWARLLDIPTARIPALAAEASRRGWLNYRQAGGVIEIRFPQLLAAEEKEMQHGPD